MSLPSKIAVAFTATLIDRAWLAAMEDIDGAAVAASDDGSKAGGIPTRNAVANQLTNRASDVAARAKLQSSKQSGGFNPGERRFGLVLTSS
ncbi:hypothetical protein Trydic_g9271 [Trypoxylus dichotomus]